MNLYNTDSTNNSYKVKKTITYNTSITLTHIIYNSDIAYSTKRDLQHWKLLTILTLQNSLQDGIYYGQKREKKRNESPSDRV